MESEKLAEWLIIGFKRAWRMKDVYAAAGLGDEACASVHERHRFMPPNNHSINRPVRAFFAAEWPKLNAFLCKHEGDAAKMLSVIPQMLRLTAKGVRGEIRGAADVIDMRKERKESRAVSQCYRLSRAAFKTHGADWNVCK